MAVTSPRVRPYVPLGSGSLHSPGALPGLVVAVIGVLLATCVHRLLPAVPMLTASVLLGIAAAHLPGTRQLLRGVAKAGLAVAGKRLMRVGVVLLGLKLSLSDVAGLGWATVGMVLAVVAATFAGTYWLGRRMGLPGDLPLLVATGYSICGASAIGAVSQVTASEEEDIAGSVALVTLCGTLAIVVLPLLHAPLGLDPVQFGRWAGASVHDVGQVVATAQAAGPVALREAVLVKLMRVVLLAPLTAGIGIAVRRSRRERPVVSGRRPPVLPLFVVGFLAMIALRGTGLLGAGVLASADRVQQLVLATALFGLGTAVNLRAMVGKSGGRVALLGLASWVVVAGVSYGGVLLTT
ncbi:YeiH family protein [Streptomyces sp. NBC_01190]|uniref:YeiH family protein n=1 Tax=Streptomyces sp. NBC_01190 TaxID=2903767 RepID=UPI003870EE63|nr:putative sulfate exporter family transporter [Streptomyces sp. NBC_01190]